MTLDQLPPRYREQAIQKLGLANAKGRPFFSSNAHSAPASKTDGIGNATSPKPNQRPANGPSHGNSAKLGFRSLLKAHSTQEATKAERRHRQTLTPDMADNIVKDIRVSPDGNEVRITLGVDPSSLPTAQQKGAFVGKDGRVHFFTKAKVAKAEKALVKALSPYAHLTRNWGDDIAIAVSIVFCFPYPTSTPKKKLIQYGYHTSRADVDNIYKGFGDSLTEAGFWKDDSLISDLHLKKFRVIDTPRIGLCIRNLTPRGSDLFSSPAPTATTATTAQDHP